MCDPTGVFPHKSTCCRQIPSGLLGKKLLDGVEHRICDIRYTQPRHRVQCFILEPAYAPIRRGQAFFRIEVRRRRLSDLIARVGLCLRSCSRQNTFETFNTMHRRPRLACPKLVRTSMLVGNRDSRYPTARVSFSGSSQAGS